MNRLLMNMQNKIETINGSIGMIYQLKNGETITVKGLHTMSFKAKEDSNSLNETLEKLFIERENLQNRVDRMRR